MSTPSAQPRPSLSTPQTLAATPHPRGLRIAGAAGVLAVIAVVASFMVLPSDSGGQDPTAIAARYANGSTGYLRATVLQALSIALLCVFLAGLCTAIWHRAQAVSAAAAAVGGTLLLSCELIGYGLIATLALGTAASRDASTVIALYDLSAVVFVVANVGLAVLCGATGTALMLRGPTMLAGASIVMTILALLGVGTLTQSGIAGIHGDLGFALFVLQLLWIAAISGWLLRSRR